MEKLLKQLEFIWPKLMNPMNEKEDEDSLLKEL
jgi:hypothetical protein